MKKILVYTALIVIFALFAATCGAISVSFNPNPQITPLGQNFTNILRLDTTTLIHGYSLSIRYDSSRLTYVSATRGTLFNGQSILWWRVNVDTLNILHVECIIAQQGYAMGPGNLLNMTFTASAGDYTQLTVDSFKLYDLSGGYITGIESVPGDIIIGTQPAYIKARCWLQGPYSNGAMLTGINSVIPFTSPYTADPAVAESIPEDAVDWVLMELRSSYNGLPISQESLFLGSDGYLRSPGKPYVILMNAPPGPYYVVLRHRNHLAIMSSSAFLFASSGTPPTLDLTSIANIYGSGGVIEIQTGIVAMAAGDADSNGSIAPTDRNAYWRVQAGLNGYLSADFSLDAYVAPSDLNQFWRVNTGLLSMVPAAQ